MTDVKLSAIEAQRTIAVLEECLEKLAFLGSITPDVLALVAIRIFILTTKRWHPRVLFARRAATPKILVLSLTLRCA